MDSCIAAFLAVSDPSYRCDLVVLRCAACKVLITGEVGTGKMAQLCPEWP